MNTLKAWLPVFAIALAAFILVTSELLPVGLLPDIANGLNEKESTTGLLMTGYAWLVAIVSLPLTILTAGMDRKKLLIVLLCFFTAGNIVAGFASSYGMMLFARGLVAVGHSVFWGITPPLAARLAPGGRYTMGIGMVSAGVTLATIFGVPFGTFIGHTFGWRAGFLLVSGVGLAIMAVLTALLPTLPSQNAGSIRSLPSLAKNKSLLACYGVTVLIVTAHFTPYTYLVPYLKSTLAAEGNVLVIMLTIFGASAIPGIFLASKLVDTQLRRLMITAAIFFIVALSGLYLTKGSLLGTMLLLMIWATAVASVEIIFQVWVMKAAPQAVDIAMATHSGIFNIGIGMGAVLGGLSLDHFGANYLGFSGVIFVIPAFVLIYFSTKVFAKR